MNLLLPFAISMLLSMALIPPLLQLASRLRVLDAPGERKVHAAPIPRIGGIAMGIAALVPLLLWLPLDDLLRAYVVGALVLLLAGALDDRYTLGAGVKLAGQLLAIGLFLWFGGVTFSDLFLLDRLALPAWLAYALTLLFLLAVTNAVNLSDGLDGLAGGLTLLSCALLALLGHRWNLVFPQTMAIVVIGAIFGFLRFNTYPARVFMGDAGSQFLGFTIGALCVYLVQRDHTALSTSLGLFLVGLPLVDTLSVMALRLRAGHSPFAADRRHLHHRLLALGFDHYEAVAAIYGLQCLLLLLGWQLRFSSDLLLAATFASLVLLNVYGLGWFEQRGWRRYSRASDPPSPLARAAAWLVASDRLQRWSKRIAGLSTSAYLFGIALTPGPVPRDVAWLAAGAAAVLAVAFLFPRRSAVSRWSVRGMLYVAVMTAVYLDHRVVHTEALLRLMKYVFLPLLVLSVVVAVRTSRQQRFGATPLDLILVFGALALPNLPGIQAMSPHLGVSVAKLLALTYAVEMIATLGSRLRVALHGVGLLFFLLLIMQAWLRG